MSCWRYVWARSALVTRGQQAGQVTQLDGRIESFASRMMIVSSPDLVDGTYRAGSDGGPNGFALTDGKPSHPPPPAL